MSEGGAEVIIVGLEIELAGAEGGVRESAGEVGVGERDLVVLSGVGGVAIGGQFVADSGAVVFFYPAEPGGALGAQHSAEGS